MRGEASAAASAGPAPGRGTVWAGCPYLGLVPFQERDKRVFYGRGDTNSCGLNKLVHSGHGNLRRRFARLECTLVPCPSAADPGRNPHRAGSGWTLRTVVAILANPRYTGRQVRNRQPSQAVLADPASTGLGYKQVQRWNLPEGWVISKRPCAHGAGQRS